MRYQSEKSQGVGGLALAGAGGAAIGGAGVAAAQWMEKTASRANIGLGVGLATATVSLVGGNANNDKAREAADLSNRVNSLVFTVGGATGDEVGKLKQEVAGLANIVSKGLSNTDPMTVAGLRNSPTLPLPASTFTTSTNPAPISTAPATGVGNLGFVLLAGVVIWLMVKD